MSKEIALEPVGTGDKGQRYEVTFFNPYINERQIAGWSETPEGAQRLANGIEKHPAWQFPQIRDRGENRG